MGPFGWSASTLKYYWKRQIATFNGAFRRFIIVWLVGKLPLESAQFLNSAMVIALKKGETDLRSEEHTSELQSLMRISYAVFCLKKKNKKNPPTTEREQNSNKRSAHVL